MSAWGALGLILGLATSPFKSLMLLSVVFRTIIAFLLFRKPANAWFAMASDATSS